jgi:2,3-bisphosphoglycerate-independent phosphoglycerate mutase
MVDPETKKTHTAHTTNLVPFAIFGTRGNIKLRENGKLADVAPTILDLMGLNPPEEMTGKSMIEKVYCE